MSTMMSDDFILEVPDADSCKMWQGLQGPYYIPSVDSLGNISWTNTGGLTNPATVNIMGKGLTIIGVVAATTDLPASANEFECYLVGSNEEYYAYMYANSEWVNIGRVAKGDKGDQGDPGEGVPTGGTTGQVLKKRSGTNYDTEWGSAGEPATEAPLSDGTAATGSSTKYAREDHVHPLNVAASGTPAMDGTASLGSAATYARTDHVHPTDTSRQETLVSGTNIKTINNTSLLGSGNITIGGGTLYFDSVAVSATTGDIATVSNVNITADHVIAECVFANPNSITTKVTWTIGSGSLTLSGTCTSATTVDILLVKKDN